MLAIGLPIKTIVPTERHKQADSLLAQCKAGGDVRNIEGLRWNKEGTIIPVLLTLSLLKNDKDEVVGIATFAKDISARKLAEEEVKRISKVFMDATDPILIDNSVILGTGAFKNCTGIGTNPSSTYSYSDIPTNWK